MCLLPIVRPCVHGSAPGLTHCTHLTHSLICDHSHPDLYCTLPLGVFGRVLYVFTNPYRTGVLTVRNPLVLLVWTPCHLPILTSRHMQEHWILVWSGRPLPTLTIHYHASILGLHRFLTFTIHHLRGDTHEHTVHEPCVVRVMCVLNGLLG